MTPEEIKSLNRGDIVKHLGSPRSFIVTGNYGGRVTAVATVDITDPIEWEVMARAETRWVIPTRDAQPRPA